MELIKLGSSGPEVELLQSVLLTLGLYKGRVDGVFGTGTENSVRRFQKNFGLSSDGIVGEKTWNKLMPYINGYFIYVVNSGDSIYSIGKKFGTATNRIIAANPNIAPTRINVGEKIVVPLGNIVKTNVSYFYDLLSRNVDSLKRVYPFIEVGSIGRSVMNKEIPYIKLGVGENQVFYSASIHANEWITSLVLMKFAENYLRAYLNNGKIYGYDVRKTYEKTSIYIVPMCNPDGVDLVTGAIDRLSGEYNRAKQISQNYPQISFPSGWKANIAGTDLNLQFPAEWEVAKRIKFAMGFTTPAPRDFVGDAPLNQPESVALYNFTQTHNFRLILAYHTQGRIIYWKFLNYNPPDALVIGRELSRITGYKLEDTPYSSGFAGYKDWFIQDYNRPGYTIEVGSGINPLPISQFSTIYRENEGALITSANI